MRSNENTKHMEVPVESSDEIINPIAPTVPENLAHLFRVGDKVKFNSSWLKNAGKEGVIIAMQGSVATEAICQVKTPEFTCWARMCELDMVEPAFTQDSQDGLKDMARMDWLSENPARLEDVLGHWCNVEGCANVREAVDALMAMKEGC